MISELDEEHADLSNESAHHPDYNLNQPNPHIYILVWIKIVSCFHRNILLSVDSTLQGLNAKSNGDLIDDFEQQVSKEHSYGAVEEHSHQVPNASIPLICQILNVHCQNEVKSVCKSSCDELLPNVEAEDFPRTSLSRKEFFDHQRTYANDSQDNLDKQSKNSKQFALLWGLCILMNGCTDSIWWDNL